MPIPKSKQKEYGKIVGHLINMGDSLESAKNKADSAIEKKEPVKKVKSKKAKKVAGFMSVMVVAWLGIAQARTCTFAWDQVVDSDVKGYRLYSSVTSDGQVKGTNFTDILVTALPDQTKPTYGIVCNEGSYWKVTVYDVAGNESDFSNQVQVPNVAPLIPKNFRLNNVQVTSNGQITATINVNLAKKTIQ